MIVTYYADVLFAQNFVLDFILLFLIHPERKKSYLRLVAASLLGASAVLIGLALCYETGGLCIVLRLMSGVGMIAIAVPFRGVGELLCNVFLLYGSAGCICGISNLLSEIRNVSQKISYITILISVFVLLMGKQMYWFRKNRYCQLRYRYSVTIKSGEKQMTLNAFYDSGNHLFEPVSGKPVMLIRDCMKPVLGSKEKLGRVIPYSSVGKHAGILSAYPVDEVTVSDGKSEMKYKDMYIAFVADDLFEQESCDVILHAQQGRGYA